VWLNSGLVDEDEAHIAPDDHGFLVGDGVFETLRSYAGVPFAVGEHAERLAAGASKLGIEAPPPERFEEAVRAVLEANGLADARIRATLTSGPGPPGLTRGPGPPTFLVSARSMTPWPPTTSAIVSDSIRHDESSPLAAVKTIGLADSVMALREARERGADEALLLNTAGEIVEATTANLFIVLDGRLETPPPGSGCLLGITRERVIALSHEIGSPAVQPPIRPLALKAADEAFLTSSTREIQPLVQIDGQPVGNGEPGPVTKSLAAAFSEMVQAKIAAG
jgi:branched-chain amino acid aminotransferase